MMFEQFDINCFHKQLKNVSSVVYDQIQKYEPGCFERSELRPDEIRRDQTRCRTCGSSSSSSKKSEIPPKQLSQKVVCVSNYRI